MTNTEINHWDSYKSGVGFLSYLRDSSLARNYCRDQIKHLITSGQANSLIEVGIGGRNEINAMDSFFKEYPCFTYTGTDWTAQFVREAQAEFPSYNFRQLDIVSCQIEDWMKADIVYSQHVVEHCPGLNPPLRNMLKMANKVFINIFFIPPGDHEVIDPKEYPLYHNRYSHYHIDKVCRHHGFEPYLYAFNNKEMKDANECQDEVVLIALRK